MPLVFWSGSDRLFLQRLTAWIFPRSETWAIEARILLWLTLLWLGIGLVVLFSASYPVAYADGDGFSFVKRQVAWAILGLIGLNFVTSAPLRHWVKASQTLLVALAITTIATLFFGIEVNGASRWLGFGPLRFQPSEIIKPFLILQGAAVFSAWPRLTLSKRLLWLSIFGTIVVAILLQPNLSTAALCGMLLWFMALAAGLPYLHLIAVAVSGIFLAGISISLNTYQFNRIASFLDPWANGQEHGYQLIQSLYAVALGQVTGSGFGLSQQKLFYLPFQHTDFIFSVFAEEFGLIGTLLFLMFLLVYASLGILVALRSPQLVNKLSAMGAVILIIGQSMINIGVSLGVLPTTGLPLPFFSYGGNSLIACLLTTGILIRVARENREAAVIPISSSERRRRQRKRLARRHRTSDPRQSPSRPGRVHSIPRRPTAALSRDT